MFLLVGLPLALLLLRAGEGWIAAVADALPLGLVLVTLGATLYSWLGWAGVVLSLVGWVASLVFCVLRRAELPKASRPNRRALLIALAWLVLLVVAMSLRIHDDNFLPWVGDMGAYVNWANEFARTGVLTASWPPVFPVFLAIGSAAFGAAHTTTMIGVSGLILIVAIARILQRLRVNGWIVFGAALLVSLQPDAVWYSTFPSSESIDTPIFVAWIMLFLSGLDAPRRQLPVILGAQVLLTVELSLLRGSGTLLVLPLVVAVFIALLVRGWRPIGIRMLLALSAAGLGAGLGYWYGIERIPRYFVGQQIRSLAPRALSDLLERLGLFSATPAVFLLCLVPAAAIALLAWLLHRRGIGTRVEITGGRGALAVGFALAGILVLGVVGDLVVHATVWFILLRLGIWLVVGTVVVLALLGRSTLPRPHAMVGLLFGTTIIMFIGLHTLRLGVDRGHNVYLYWDRYLVSEVLPAMVVLCGLGAGIAWTALSPRLSTIARRRTALAIAAAVAVAVSVVPAIGPLVLQAQGSYMAGAYDFTRRLMALRDNGDESVIWSGTSTGKAPGWYFPNTWMAFALPMHRSFGVDLVNVTQKKYNFGPDDVLTTESLVNDVACRPDADRLIVFEAQTGGPSLDERVSTDLLTLTPLKTTTSSIALLSQPPKPGWTSAQITVKAWSVSATGTLPAGTKCLPVGHN